VVILLELEVFNMRCIEETKLGCACACTCDCVKCSNHHNDYIADLKKHFFRRELEEAREINTGLQKKIEILDGVNKTLISMIDGALNNHIDMEEKTNEARKAWRDLLDKVDEELIKKEYL